MTNQTTIISSVDISAIDAKHVKQRMGAIAMGAIDNVKAQTITSTMASVAKELDKLVANHPNPNGDDVKRTLKLWASRQNVATMLAVFAHYGLVGKLRERVFHYASVCGAQRSGNPYLALKAHQKLLATCAWFISGDARCWWNVCKYLLAQIVTAEVLDKDVIANVDIYDVYQSNSMRIEELTKDCDHDMRARLLDAQLYKSAGTASTQRTTSANILQILNAGTNAGNERVIYFDRESAPYIALRDSIFNA